MKPRLQFGVCSDVMLGIPLAVGAAFGYGDEISLLLGCALQVSVTLENFQDISLPIPGKEDLAKLHSASCHQTALVKAGSCGEAPQGWIAIVMEYIKR